MSTAKSEDKKVTTHTLQEMKKRGEKISMLTAYDFSLARILDAAGIDVLLVGDSAIDLETARRAGAACCLVAYGFGFRQNLLDQRGPGVCIASNTAELAHAIDAFITC